MPLADITRRGLLAGASAAVLASAVPALARPRFLSGGSPTTATTGDIPLGSITYTNTAGTTSPTLVPLTVPMWFSPGDVPAGRIAVPQIGGVDAAYQAGALADPWGDGSMFGGPFYVVHTAALAAGGSVTISFVSRAGSYSNASSITPTDFVNETDHTVAIRQCHTATYNFSSANNAVVSLSLSGGQISAVNVAFWAGTAIVSGAVTGGGGSGGVISISAGGVPTINSPGSGFGFVGGTGSFDTSFNAGIATYTSSGNNNGVCLTRYAQGQVLDAIELRMPIPGLDHGHVTFSIERWKNPNNGNLLGYYRYAEIGNGLVDTAHTMTTLTMDVDWKDGSTVIRGATNGDTGYTAIPLYMSAAFPTFSADGKGDWSVNSAAYNAIEQRRTQAECDQLRATGVIPSWDNIIPTTTVPTTPGSYENSLNGGEINLCVFVPMGTAGVRCPDGSGGQGNNEFLITQPNAQHFMAMRAGLSGVGTWLRNSRVGAAHNMGSTQGGGIIYEKTTLLYPNVIPASAQSFAGMTPTREAGFVSDITQAGVVHPLIQAKGNLNGGAEPYHQACYWLYPYIIEGQRWMIRAGMNCVANVLYGTSYTFRRQATLGTTTYYGIYAGMASNVRIQAWHERTIGYVSKFAPPSVEKSYFDYCLKRQFEYFNDLIAYIGNVKIGSGGTTNSKTIDFTGSGLNPEMYSPNIDHQQGIVVPFMQEYRVQVLACLGWLHQGTATGALIQAYRDHEKISYVKRWAGSGSHFGSDSFRILGTDGIPPALAVDPTWSSIGDVANPKLGISSNSNTTLTFASGSSTATLSSAWVLYGTTRLGNGSRVRLTTTNISATTAGVGVSIPSPFDTTTYYYWKELTSTTAQLCTDAALTNPVVASANSAGSIYLWASPSNMPADNSGHGTFNGALTIGGASRIAQTHGTLQFCQAMGMADDANGDVSSAIANTGTIFNAVPGQIGYVNYPLYCCRSSRT